MKTRLQSIFIMALFVLCMKPAMADAAFFEDFEGQTFPPAGWTVYSLLDDSQNWDLHLWQNITPGGTQSAYHNSTSGDDSVDNWLITPQLSIANDGFHYLSFWGYLANSWSYKSNTVLISTGSPNPADEDYIVVWDNASDLGNAWVWARYFIDLEDYIGQDIYVAFRYEGDTWGHTWNIDDVTLVDDSPSFSMNTTEVSQATGFNGTGNQTVEISNSGIQDLTFEIEIEYADSDGWLLVDPLNGNVASQSFVEISLSFDAYDLDFGTYEANLIITTNDTENPTANVLVTFEVIDVNVYPFTENFDSETFPPIGWTKYDIDGDGTEWALSWYNITPNGQYSALHNYAWSPQDGWLVTPQISVPDEGFFYLSFWSLVGDVTWYDKNSVLISAGSGNPADEDFVEVWTEENVSDSWTQQYINLEAFAGEDIFIAFRYEGNAAHFWVIDDIALGEEVDDSPVMVVTPLGIEQSVSQTGTSTNRINIHNEGILPLTFDVENVYVDEDGWLEVAPVSGSVAGNSTQQISLLFHGMGLDFGSYTANITITSNDTENPEVTIPVTMNVIDVSPVNVLILQDEYTFPVAISENGQHIVGSPFGGLSGYYWSEESGVIVISAGVNGVSNSGEVVVSYEDPDLTYNGFGVNVTGRWSYANQEFEFLGMNPALPEFVMNDYSFGWGMSSDGIIAGVQVYEGWNVKAFSWTEEDGYDNIGDHPLLPDNNRPNGITANGEIVYGWAQTDFAGRSPVVWHNGEIIFIDESLWGEAFGGSPNAQYIVGSIGVDGFLWNSDTEELTLFENTINFGSLNPVAVSNDGYVFGYTAEGFPALPPGRRAFVRDPNGILTTFNDYAVDRGWFDAADWTFYAISGISGDGNRLIGAGINPDGLSVSFMLDFDPAQPSIEVDPVSVNQTLSLNGSAQQNLGISNNGTGDLVYNAVIQFVNDEVKIQETPAGRTSMKRNLELDVLENTDGFHPATDTKNKDGVILNYDGANVDAIGLIAGGTFYGAARYPSEMVAPYGGYVLESVDLYINDIPDAIKLMIWDAGTTTSPGSLLHEQVFTPAASSWNTVVLDEALAVSGADLWVGVMMTHEAGSYILGVDGGPPNMDGNWLTDDGISWEHLSDYGLNSNWNIRAKLQYGGVQWLSIDPANGVVAEGTSQDMMLHFNAEGLEAGTYQANIRISSNDMQNPLVIVPVTLVATDGEAGFTVTFEVEDQDGDEITDAIITLNGIENEAGNYLFHNVLPGTYTYHVDMHCFGQHTGDVTITDEHVLVNVVLEALSGDATGDGVINVLDIIAISNYYIGNNPDNFCFENADVNGDNVIDILDIIAVVNIFRKGEVSPVTSLISEPASLYLTNDGISLDSDGTLAGIQFEIAGDVVAVELAKELNGYQLVSAYENGVLRVMIFSLDNMPIPSGLHSLVSFVDAVPAEMISARAGNLNADEVPVVIHHDEVTGIMDASEIGMNVYPNPVSDRLFVDFYNDGQARVSLVNVHGQIVAAQQVTDSGQINLEFNIHGLPQGIYMLQLDHGAAVVTEKVIVQ